MRNLQNRNRRIQTSIRVFKSRGLSLMNRSRICAVETIFLHVTIVTVKYTEEVGYLAHFNMIILRPYATSRKCAGHD